MSKKPVNRVPYQLDNNSANADWIKFVVGPDGLTAREREEKDNEAVRRYYEELESRLKPQSLPQEPPSLPPPNNL